MGARDQKAAIRLSCPGERLLPNGKRAGKRPRKVALLLGLLEPASPASGFAMQVHHRHDEQKVSLHLIDNAVGEPLCKAAASPL